MLFPLFLNHSSHTLWSIPSRAFLRLSANQRCCNSLVLIPWQAMGILANIFQSWKLPTKSFGFPFLLVDPEPPIANSTNFAGPHPGIFWVQGWTFHSLQPQQPCQGDQSCWGSTRTAVVPQCFQLSSAGWQQLDTTVRSCLIKAPCLQIWPENKCSIMFQEKGSLKWSSLPCWGYSGQLSYFEGFRSHQLFGGLFINGLTINY